MPLNIPARESNVQVQRVLDLLDDSDSVEFKLTVLDSERTSAMSALDLEILDATIRQVVFFDTPDLRLQRAGVVVRARRLAKGGDSVIKLRPVVPADLPRTLRHSDNFKIEIDAMPGRFTCSASLKAAVDNQDVKDVLAGTRPVRKLFSRDQRIFYSQHAPEGLRLDDLVPLGPINAVRLAFTPRKLGRRLGAELWFYPDGTRVLELSTKCAPAETLQAAVQTRAFLTRCGISITADQQTKTNRALEYFAQFHGNGNGKRPQRTAPPPRAR